MLSVTDDSGFLALVDPTAYSSFIGEDWTFEEIHEHILEQMTKHSILFWGTGLGGFYDVEVSQKKTRRKGYREVTGPLVVTGGSILVTNYESISMAARYEHVLLPEEFQKQCLVRIPNGSYSCRIVQMFDPDEDCSAGEGKPDFLIELQSVKRKPSVWTDIPWATNI